MQRKLSVCFAVLLSGWLAPTTATGRAGTLGGFSVEQTFDAHLRPSVLSVKNGGTLASATSAYDAASRLQSVGDGTYSAHYSYVYKSPLVEKIDFKQNSTLRLTQQNGYDFIKRLSAITNATSVAVSRHTYVYNHANQRTSAALQDGSYWVYQYDNLGQVKVGKRYWSDGTAVAGQQFEYTHDDIGNRTATKAGGDSAGASLRSATYSPTRLNQYASRTVPGAVDILGIGHALATVAVNGQAAYRTNEYYQKALSFDNSSAAVYTNVSVTASLGGSTVTNTGKVFLPTATESFAYDADGNLTNDTRWAYTWDSENRLIKMISKIGGVTPNQIDFEYDYAGRRIKKAVTNGGNVTTTKYLYRDWRVLAEVNGSNGLIRSYMWGLDLSGTPDQAGGVGGLLSVKPNGGPAHFASYDGNGNVTALVKGDDATVSARYEYGPFGELIRMSGPMATANPIRFSTKITDDETDLIYYGFRYFNPNTGRWLSGDPIGESGGINLYGFAANNPIGFVDLWGLRPAPPNIEAIERLRQLRGGQ